MILKLFHCYFSQGGLFDDVISDKKQKDRAESVEEEEEEPEKTAEKSRPRTKSGRAVPAGAVSIFGG